LKKSNLGETLHIGNKTHFQITWYDNLNVFILIRRISMSPGRRASLKIKMILKKKLACHKIAQKTDLLLKQHIE